MGNHRVAGVLFLRGLGLWELSTTSPAPPRGHRVGGLGFLVSGRSRCLSSCHQLPAGPVVWLHFGASLSVSGPGPGEVGVAGRAGSLVPRVSHQREGCPHLCLCQGLPHIRQESRNP